MQKKGIFSQRLLFALFLSISFFKVKRLSYFHLNFLHRKVTTFYSNNNNKKTYYKTCFLINNFIFKPPTPFSYQTQNSNNYKTENYIHDKL